MLRCDCIVTFQESRIAEALFLPPKPVPKKQLDEDESNHAGSRISARQQQKRERALKKKREKEAAEALLGTKSKKYCKPYIYRMVVANVALFSYQARARERRSFVLLRKLSFNGTQHAQRESLLARQLSFL